MNWLDKLERKFGRHYIRDLTKIITIVSALSFALFYVIAYTKGINFFSMLTLNPEKILHGQVWRIFTFVFVTPTDIISTFFTLYIFYIMGISLEREWGEFKYNIYCLIVWLSAIVITLLVYVISGKYTGYSLESYTTLILYSSLFLAFAKLFPDFTLLLFFVLPVKIKYLGYLAWAGLGLSIIVNLINLNFSAIALTIVPIISYLIFFGRYNYQSAKYKSGSVIRMKDYQKKMKKAKKTYIHRCEVCGKNNVDNPDEDFRYCSKCNGKHCYCSEHIFNHKHIE